MMAKEIVGIVLDEPTEDLGGKIPDILLDRINPPCRLEWARSKNLESKGMQVVFDVCHNTEGMEGTLNEIVGQLEQDEELIVET